MTRPTPAPPPSSRAWGGLWLGGLVWLGGCASAQRPPAWSPEVSTRLQAVLDREAAAQRAPGMVMAVRVGRAAPWVGVTGCQDEGCRVKMKPEATFRVGSITKSFVGAAILMQADEGKLRLEDTLEQWLPGVFAHIDGRGITLRQLLTHTSGIENFTDAVKWNRAVYTAPTRPWKAPWELLSLADTLRASNKEVIAPGTRFAYSNTNYVLLGMIAAKADGHPVTEWRAVIQKRILDRLGLHDSHLPIVGEVGLGSANHGYVNFYRLFFEPQTGTSACVPLNPPCKDVDVDITEQDVSNADAAGALVSTAGDMLTWAQALAQGTLVSARTRERQQSFSSTCAPGTAGCGEWADQVGLALFKQPKYGLLGIHGEILGFSGTVQYLPEKALTIVVLSNRTTLDGRSVKTLPEDVVEALYPELKPSSQPVQSSNRSDAGPAAASPFSWEGPRATAMTGLRTPAVQPLFKN